MTDAPQRLTAPRLFVVGSASEELAKKNNYDPPMTDLAGACQAAQDIGRQAAAAGWHLQVYSLHRDFIEYQFVKGYADPEVGDAAAKVVHVHFAEGADEPDPTLQARQDFGCHFEPYPYSSKRWEVAFYRPLSAAAALVVIGGGRATLATGIVALTQRIPLFPAAFFGGSGRVVWQAMEAEKDLVTDRQYRAMGSAWDGASSAVHCLQVIEEQRKTREEEQRGERQRRLQLSEAAEQEAQEAKEAQQRRQAEQVRNRRSALTLHGLVTLGSLAVTVFCVSHWQEPGDLPPFFSALLTSLFAGIAGASVYRLRLWLTTSPESGDPLSEVVRLVPGALAGFIASLIFIVGQAFTLPDAAADTVKTEQLRNMIPFVAVISVIAGHTWKSFLDRLVEQEVETKLPGIGE